MTESAELQHRVTFQKRVLGENIGGNVQEEWETQFTVQAKMRAKMGGEEVTAARLEGKQPWRIIVRQSSQTLAITTDWRAIDARNSDRIFNITSIVDPDDEGRWLELLCQTGVAT